MTSLRLMVALASSASALCFGSGVLAQTAPATPAATTGAATTGAGATPEIVVTANRREQRLQQVPLAVTAISTQSLRTQGINSVGDLGAGRVPGLTIGSSYGNEVTLNVAMRGLNQGDPGQSTQDTPVAFYIDGVNFPRPQATGSELIEPERVEVLRGPQGQLFGRNAEGG